MDSIKSHFFGRRTLLEDIVQGVLTPNQPLDFSLVGPKMIGKSRLLKYLASPQGPLLGPDPNGWRPERFQDGQNVIVGLYDCDWSDAQINLLQFVKQQLRQQLETEPHLGLDWSKIEGNASPSQQIRQIIHQLGPHIRLVLILDNFDQVLLSDKITPDMVNELRPLTNDLGLIVATDDPLHDLNQTVAASPLFNVMHQHFVGLVESEAAEAWIDAYQKRIAYSPAIKQILLEMAGGHPFLLARINDTLLELAALLSDQEVDTDHTPLLKLRLAEYGRPLFELIWRKLKNSRDQAMQALVKQLTRQPLPIGDIPPEQTVALNRLINQAVVTYSHSTYHLFSPLFQEFLADQLEVAYEIVPSCWPATAQATVPSPGQTDIFDKLTPIEAELLRYFQAHSQTVLSTEQLLAEVWHQPQASPRRVQEAIRRLRNSLTKYKPRLGFIENERGVGYRYEPD